MGCNKVTGIVVQNDEGSDNEITGFMVPKKLDCIVPKGRNNLKRVAYIVPKNDITGCIVPKNKITGCIVPKNKISGCIVPKNELSGLHSTQKRIKRVA